MLACGNSIADVPREGANNFKRTRAAFRGAVGEQIPETFSGSLLKPKRKPDSPPPGPQTLQ